MAEVPNDGHGGVDNSGQERRSLGAVRGRGGGRISGPAPDRQHPANARNPSNPARLTGQAAGVRIVAVATDPGAPPRAVHANGVARAAIAPAPFGVGGNPVALAQAGAPAGQAPPAQADAGLIANAGGAPAGQAPVQPYFDLDAGLSGPPLRRSEVGSFF